MSEPTPIAFPLFDFMDIRSPQALSPRRRRRGFIDDLDAPKHGPFRDITGQPELTEISPMAKIVSDTVRNWTGDPSNPEALEGAMNALKAALIAGHAQLNMVKHTPPGFLEEGTAQATFSSVETGVWLSEGVDAAQRLYLLPDHPGRLAHAMLYDGIQAAGRIIDKHLAGTTWDRDVLVSELGTAISWGTIDGFVWNNPRNDDSFLLAHRTLFDVLYLMYVTRRWTGFKNLEPITTALQTLHVIAVLGTDRLLHRLWEAGEVSDVDSAMLDRLAAAWPELQRPQRRREWPWTFADIEGWDRDPLIASTEDLRTYRSASPVIHQMFAQLFWRGRPFNDIKPIGCGDLKVVRDRLDRYHAVDIADIQNVMKGETRRRTHTRLNRTETSFSLDEATLSDTTRDTQTTERFEVKSAAERVLRDQQTLNVNANTSLTYGGLGSVKVAASAGLAYASSRSFEDHLESSRSFARDVVDRAVERVETKHAVSRSTTTVVETKEQNFHEFTSPDSHTSGIYQWVEAEYTAQVFSYGRRTMFEFMIPEPAAFWVAAKLAGYEDTLELPKPPDKPSYEEVKLEFSSTAIDSKMFASLSTMYDLRDLPEPPPYKRIILRRTDNGSQVFQNEGKEIPSDPPNPLLAFDAKLEGAAGYDADSVDIVGGWVFHDGDEDNQLTVTLNGFAVLDSKGDQHFHTAQYYNKNVSGLNFVSDNVGAHFQFKKKAKQLYLTFALNLHRSNVLYEKWQNSVFSLVETAERKRVDQRNAELHAQYESLLAQYKAAVAQVRATPIMDLLAGGPQAENRRVIAMELKKHCISMIAKEFDAHGEGDILESLSPMGHRTVDAENTWLEVQESDVSDKPTTAFFKVDKKSRKYPAINMGDARQKGRIVQFLDQAFEWEKISYLFFDYFYANMPRWVELINREDAADPLWAAFLSAGQTRVLIAVTPKYEVAVQHFLDTREPWNGTNADPVLDDPLFIPLFDEIRARTDDRSGGTPCGLPWSYRVPVSLPYLRGSETTLPDLEKDRQNVTATAPDEGPTDGEPNS